MAEVWFQNLILAVTAVIAILTISTSSRHERRRATVDIVRDQQKDEVLIDARAIIRALQDSKGKINFDPILAQRDSLQLRAIYNVLNSYEFMASGLRTEAFDETTYKRMYYNTVITNWDLFREFVEKYREKYKRENPGVDALKAETLFQDFEKLATSWKKHPLKQIGLRRRFQHWREERRKEQALKPVLAPVPPATASAPAQPPSQQPPSA